MTSYDPISIDKQVLGFVLDNDFFSKVSNIVTRDMFTGEMRDVFDVISYAHTQYGTSVNVRELGALFNDRNPAMPDSTREKAQELIAELEAGTSDKHDLYLDLVNNFWLRDRARQIGEKAIEIFTGESEDFGGLRQLIDVVEDGRISDKTTYRIVDTDFDTLLEDNTGEPDFPFEFDLIREHVPGLDRGNLGILFARPEVGKTTFCSFLAASYIRQGFNKSKDEMVSDKAHLMMRYVSEIKPYLTIIDAIGTSVEEANDYAKLNSPDVMFMDQLDKFRIGGEYNRGDERLKETYVLAREIAKRNRCLVWAVSQASYEAHDRQFIDYSMLDNSRTGKAGEADIIIGIGKTGASDVTNTVRHICISKNKINGYHDMIHANIDVHRGVYY